MAKSNIFKCGGKAYRFKETVDHINTAEGRLEVADILADKKQNSLLASLVNSGSILIEEVTDEEAESIDELVSLKKENAQLKKDLEASKNASVIKELKTTLAQSQTEIEELKAELESLKGLPADDAEKGGAE